MGIYRKQSGITLLDILLAVTIVAVLTSIVLTIATSIQNKAAQQSCEGTLATINTALQQYKEFGYDFPLNDSYFSPPLSQSKEYEMAFYRSLKFPPDCNDFTLLQTEAEIEKLLDLAPEDLIIDDVGEYFDPNGVMYFFLNRIPQCRETLKKIDPKYIVCTQDINGNYQNITIRTNGIDKVSPWERIIDPWGNTFMYDYYVNEQEDASLDYSDMQETLRNFPLITSAGPDEIFNTPDDITNREKTQSTEYK